MASWILRYLLLVFTGMRWHHVTRNPPLVSVSAAVRDFRQMDRTMITITTREAINNVVVPSINDQR